MWEDSKIICSVQKAYENHIPINTNGSSLTESSENFSLDISIFVNLIGLPWIAFSKY